MANTINNEEYSVKEKEALVKLREALEDVLEEKPVEDYNLIRWLRARDLNIQKAEKMYRESLEWREKWHVDTILDEFQPPEVLLKYYVHPVLGFSKNGRYLVGMSRLSNIDFKGVVQSVTKDDFIRYLFWHSERCMEMMRKRTQETGVVTTQSVYIQDCEGASLSPFLYKPVMDYMKAAMQTAEINYPETLGIMIVVNAPKLFATMFNFFARFMPEATIKRVRIFGTNRDKWIPALFGTRGSRDSSSILRRNSNGSGWRSKLQITFRRGRKGS